MKCISCHSKNTKKDGSHGYIIYNCLNCGESFDDEDIALVSGRKSKNKQKFTGKHKGAIEKFGF